MKKDGKTRRAQLQAVYKPASGRWSSEIHRHGVYFDLRKWLSPIAIGLEVPTSIAAA